MYSWLRFITGFVVGTTFVVLAIIAVILMSETYNKNLDYTEE